MTWDVYLFFKQICERDLGDRDWAQDGEDSSSQKRWHDYQHFINFTKRAA